MLLGNSASWPNQQLLTIPRDAGGLDAVNAKDHT